MKYKIVEHHYIDKNEVDNVSWEIQCYEDVDTKRYWQPLYWQYGGIFASTMYIMKFKSLEDAKKYVPKGATECEFETYTSSHFDYHGKTVVGNIIKLEND